MKNRFKPMTKIWLFFRYRFGKYSLTALGYKEKIPVRAYYDNFSSFLYAYKNNAVCEVVGEEAYMEMTPKQIMDYVL